MIMTDYKEEYTVTYKVIDLVKDKYNKSFTDYNKARNYCGWCLKDGATELSLIAEEHTVTHEKLSLGSY